MCCITDLKAGKIYNIITYPSIVIGLVLNGVLSARFSMALIGFLICFLPFAAASARGLIGGGDAKLFGAVGAIGGFPYILHFLLATFLLACIYGLIILIWKKGAFAEFIRSLKKREINSKNSDARPRIPMGVFSLLGILITLNAL